MGWRVVPNSLMVSRLVNWSSTTMRCYWVAFWFGRPHPARAFSSSRVMTHACYNSAGWFGESFTGGWSWVVHKTLTDSEHWLATANGESFTQWITHDLGQSSGSDLIYKKSRWWQTPWPSCMKFWEHGFVPISVLLPTYPSGLKTCP